jgi:ribosomal protein L3 glutamine methyltransferase
LNPDGGLLCEVGRGAQLLQTEYPDHEFLWLDTAESTGEVFWIAADAICRRQKG